MFDSFTLEERTAWIHLLRGHASVIRRMDSELRAFNDLSVSAFEALALLRLAGEDPIRLSTLAHRLALTRSGASRLVDTLEKEGLVAREPDPSDGRAWLVRLTIGGSSRLNEALPTHERVVRERFLSCYTTQELGLLTELLVRLVEEDLEFDHRRERSADAQPG
jgi:DNA-binding MarR family transcriptional regulator